MDTNCVLLFLLDCAKDIEKGEDGSDKITVRPSANGTQTDESGDFVIILRLKRKITMIIKLLQTDQKIEKVTF